MATQSFPWFTFIVPGIAQAKEGERFKGLLYLLLALGTIALALSTNRYFFLNYVWRFKTLEMPQTFIRVFYASKQSTLYNFIGIYFIIGLVSAIDHVRSRSQQ